MFVCTSMSRCSERLEEWEKYINRDSKETERCSVRVELSGESRLNVD